ncbi:SH3 domain-containing protein [Poseidonocella sp. HB161398]|uniref:SH3 domain-containing protein n=1 Tax=Poseidonocella sp. HB161398 TaxID=2320855 RepID=UPI001F0CF8F0|nr:SH3 domain-containing protein [Poseidonocella sp. HB161398]
MGPLYRAVLVAVALAAAVPAAAQQRIGPETGQPLPRWVSMKAPEANARRGPSINHRIDWVFKHRNMPLLVTAEYGHWRRVVDRDGFGGWVHYVLLSRTRTVIIDQDMMPIHRSPGDSPDDILAEAQEGVIAQLRECESGWCRISADGVRGWVHEDGLWGAGDPVMPERSDIAPPPADLAADAAATAAGQ